MLLKRIICILLTAVLVTGTLPAGVFAAETETVPEETALQTVPVTEETEPAETSEETEPETTAATETELVPETEAVEVTEPAEEEEFRVSKVTGEGLLTDYLNRLFFGESHAESRDSLARLTLTGADAFLYDQLKAVIREIAAGLRVSAIAEVSFLDSGFLGGEANPDIVLDALVHDCPYELYWYSGCYYRITDKAVTLWLQVHGNYRAEGYGEFTPVLDTAQVKRAATAAENARKIVDRHVMKADYDKLAAYADEICALVSYDRSAASGGTYNTNIDPWTLVSVFDGDPSTNVVCEGYAEGFQYLCDQSFFDRDVGCYSPTGADHKWNIVRMNGVSYLMDLTMGDDGTQMNRKEFFLAGGKGTVENGYKVGGFHYWYYDATKALWGTGDDSILKLAEKNYAPSDEGADIISQDRFELLLKKSESLELTQELTLVRDLVISGVVLTVGEGGKITVPSGMKLTVEEGASVIIAGEARVTAEEGGRLIAFGPVEGSIAGDGDILLTQLADSDLRVAGRGTVADGDLDRFMGKARTAGVRSLRLMDGITGIGENAFDGFALLAEVIFPETLKTIGAGAFSGCSGLTDVTFYGDAPEMEDPADIFAGVNATMHYPQGNDTWSDEVKAGFGEDAQWATHDANLIASGTCGDNLTWTLTNNGKLTISGSGAMADYAYKGAPWYSCRENITEVVIADGVTGIGAYAFCGCEKLQTVQLHDGITKIGDFAFSTCKALKEIHIPAGIMVLRKGTFENCMSLKYVEIPANVKTLEWGVFLASGLESVTIQPGLTEIGENAFNACDSLTSVEIPGTVKKICRNAFMHCDALRTVTMGEGVERVEYSAFRTCPALTTVKLADTVTYIGDNAFTGAENIQSINIPEKLEEIGVAVFSNVKLNLEHLEFSDSIKKIGELAFAGCTGIKKISFHGPAPEIGAEAFERITATVYYPGDESWTEDKLQDYGGKLTWEVDPCLDGHDVVIDPARNPGCVRTGLTEGSHCADCGEILVAQELVPAMGHDFVAGICWNCGRDDKADYTVFSGKTITLRETDPETGKPYTAKQIRWTLSEGGDSYVTLAENGKLTAATVYAQARVEATATITQKNGTLVQLIRVVDVYPNINLAEVVCGEESVGGTTVLMDVSETEKTFRVNVYPEDTQKTVTWTISDKKEQYAQYRVEGDVLTITEPTGKAGTVTLKATVDAGMKKNITVKVQLGSYARVVEIQNADKTQLKGGEKLTLTAAITEPGQVTKPGIVWTTSDKTAATVSGGKVTAKNVAHPTVVTITATSKDGKASDSVELRILPKNEGQLVLMDGAAFVTNANKALNKGEELWLSAAVITEGVPVPVEAEWISSKAAVASVEETGLVTAVANGAAKITAVYNGMKAVVNVKVTTLASAVEITAKDGKNLDDEGDVVLASGKSLALVANVLPQGANKAVDWTITDGAQYAKIASGKITANKDLIRPVTVTVKAAAKDGSGVSGTIRVKILPQAVGVQAYREGMALRANGTYVFDMLTTPSVAFSTRVFPATASQAVELISSARKIADFNEQGELVFFQPGNVTVTVKALDGSNKKMTFKLTVVKRITDLTLKEGSDLTVVGGKSLKLAPMVQISPADATNKKLTWSVAPNDYGIKISAAGVLSTRKVTAPVTVNVMVTAQDGSGKMLSFNVTVTP